MRDFLKSGRLYIWLCGSSVATALLMILGLLLLIMVNGLGFFWPATILELSLNDGTSVLGQAAGREVIPHSVSEAFPRGESRIRIKVGNRDLYGLDFQWVQEKHIVNLTYPKDAVMIERREWGNFYGRIIEVRFQDKIIAVQDNQSWNEFSRLLKEANGIQEEIAYLEKDVIGDINYQLEHIRLDLKRLENYETKDLDYVEELQRDMTHFESLYSKKVLALEQLRTRLHGYSVVLEDVRKEQVSLPMGNIVRVLQPNSMTIGEKVLIYFMNVWTVLTDEPREANTEGGIFPAIFGTVVMVILMSLVVMPFGVLAAFYLKEYAKQGPVVRLVRIAVNNLAGVPSIVFGVFGLGFFVYAIGGTIDTTFYPEALPSPTFGTGGLLWASLTLALMTVPVVIVATEEGLSAVPREYREGSLALGATKFESMLQVIFPCALPSILTGLILAVARATGEVAPLMLTGVVKLAPSLPVDFHYPFIHLNQKFMHLGFHIYDVGFQSPNVEAAKPMVFVTTIVLVVVVLILNMTAIAIRTRMRKKYRGTAV